MTKKKKVVKKEKPLKESRKSGLTENTKNTDISNALRLIHTRKYEKDTKKLLADLNKGQKKKISMKTLQSWLKSNHIVAVQKTKPNAKLGKTRKPGEVTFVVRNKLDWKKVDKKRFDNVLGKLNKNLKTTSEAIKSQFHGLFNVKRKDGTKFGVFITADCWIVHKKQKMSRAKCKAVALRMIKKLLPSQGRKPSTVGPAKQDQQAGWNGKAVLKAQVAFTPEMYKILEREILKSKPVLGNVNKDQAGNLERTFGGIVYELGGAFIIYYCYKKGASFPCFDDSRYRFGTWYD